MQTWARAGTLPPMNDLALIDVNEIQFAQWQAPHFRPINKFYKSQKHKGKANGSDLVFYAYGTVNEEQKVLGAVRLVPSDSEDQSNGNMTDEQSGYFWLRSLYIHDALRGKQLGTKLLECVHRSLSTVPIYCFPYDHLENFYSNADYRLVAEDSLPQALKDLFDRYVQRGEKIIIMGKEPA